MEIERKFLIKRENLPENLEQYPSKAIEQGYLCTEPVVRIRKSNDNYYLTYKSKGLLAREEYNLPLTKESYEHLKSKADGIVISKVRYVIPEKDGYPLNWTCSKPPTKAFSWQKWNSPPKKPPTLTSRQSGSGRM